MANKQNNFLLSHYSYSCMHRILRDCYAWHFHSFATQLFVMCMQHLMQTFMYEFRFCDKAMQLTFKRATEEEIQIFFKNFELLNFFSFHQAIGSKVFAKKCPMFFRYFWKLEMKFLEKEWEKTFRQQQEYVNKFLNKTNEEKIKKNSPFQKEQRVKSAYSVSSAKRIVTIRFPLLLYRFIFLHTTNTVHRKIFRFKKKKREKHA